MNLSRSFLFLLPALLLFSGCRKPEFDVIPVVSINKVGEIANSYYHYSTDPVYFINDAEGVAGGVNYLGYTGNGGATWSNILGIRPRDYIVQSINAAGNALFAFVLYDNDADSIYKSTDNGQHWLAITGGMHLQKGQAISQTQFYKTAHTSSSSSSPVLLYHTNNSGQTWTQINLPPGYSINTFHFSTSSTGLITSQNSQGMYYTSNGGTSWQAVATSYPLIDQLRTAGSRICCTSRQDDTRMIYSDDMGLNWQEGVFSQQIYYSSDFSVQQAGATGLMIGDEIIHISEDSGVNWKTYFNSDGTTDYSSNVFDSYRFEKAIVTPGGRMLLMTNYGEFFSATL